MKKIVLASSNLGKAKEIQSFLKNLNFECVLQSELGISDIEENGLTFIENAILKARHAAQSSGLPSLADDSGLIIDALHGAPGIYSARYAGPHAKDHDRINKVVQELKDVPATKRSARFYCALALISYPKNPAPILCEASWEGFILNEPRGELGFGYDPIFYVPSHDCTAAELNPQEKNKISHRGQALSLLQEKLKNYPSDYFNN